MIKEEVGGPRAGHKHFHSPLRELVVGLPFFEIRKPVLLSVASGLWTSNCVTSKLTFRELSVSHYTSFPSQGDAGSTYEGHTSISLSP